jgi:RNA polymerase sigma-70 factor (ECF subfamily)
MPDSARPLDFEAFYEATVQRLVRQFYALTGDLGDAQDIAQEAYARAWQRWSRVSRYEAPEAWVRTVGLRLAVSRWRKAQNAAVAWRRHGPLPDPPEMDPGAVVIVAALRRLPRQQRTAIVLHHLADLPVEQVAHEMQSPVGSVKAWLSRGRHALAEQLNDQSTPAMIRNESS